MHRHTVCVCFLFSDYWGVSSQLEEITVWGDCQMITMR